MVLRHYLKWPRQHWSLNIAGTYAKGEITSVHHAQQQQWLSVGPIGICSHLNFKIDAALLLKASISHDASDFHTIKQLVILLCIQISSAGLCHCMQSTFMWPVILGLSLLTTTAPVCRHLHFRGNCGHQSKVTVFSDNLDHCNVKCKTTIQNMFTKLPSSANHLKHVHCLRGCWIWGFLPPRPKSKKKKNRNANAYRSLLPWDHIIIWPCLLICNDYPRLGPWTPCQWEVGCLI